MLSFRMLIHYAAAFPAAGEGLRLPTTAWTHWTLKAFRPAAGDSGMRRLPDYHNDHDPTINIRRAKLDSSAAFETFLMTKFAS